MAPRETVLSVDDLHVQFKTDDGTVQAVDGVSFDVLENEVLGIVGESGSGKTVTALSIMGLLPKRALISGDVRFRGNSLFGLAEDQLCTLRGSQVSMIFQDALAALNPVHTVGAQIGEAITTHHADVGKTELRERVVDLLDVVGIPNPPKRHDDYPHEFSGGMRQRAMIAMAIANDPAVLIADEPTTALDVTIQAQVLEVLERVQERTHTAIVLITHDLGVVAGVADRVLVMYAGRPVEMGEVDDIFYATQHPYTLGLLASLPRLDTAMEGRRLYRIKGQPPSLIHVPPGCPYHPRCEFARYPDPCATERPQLRALERTRHVAACHYAEDVVKMQPDDLRPPIEAPAKPATTKKRPPAKKKAVAKKAVTKKAPAVKRVTRP
ncbi:MAG: peptide/nickel transport system ATP-binding protein [Gaiellales bacterium]|nr:peptide/nickel transport system ATP-binding protein [Gaiellales bacterium]